MEQTLQKSLLMHVLNVSVAAQVCTHVNTPRNPERNAQRRWQWVSVWETVLCATCPEETIYRMAEIGLEAIGIAMHLDKGLLIKELGSALGPTQAMPCLLGSYVRVPTSERAEKPAVYWKRGSEVSVHTGKRRLNYMAQESHQESNPCLVGKDKSAG